MDSIGGDEGNVKKHWNSNSSFTNGCYEETFDTQCPSSSSTFSFGNGEEPKDENAEFCRFESTVPFHDSGPLELETQLLNLDDETQELDSLDWDENVRTQLLSDCEGEVCADSNGDRTDGTEILSDDDDECERIGGDDGMGLAKRQSSPYGISGKDFVVDSDPSVDKDCSSGSFPRSFLSVRSVSFRASGHAAARSLISKGTDVDPNIESVKEKLHVDGAVAGIRDPTSVGTIAREVDWDHDTQNINGNMKGFSYETKCQGVNSTVRKLFNEDSLTRINGSVHDNDSTNAASSLHELLACNNEFAGLSYVDSQEPGEQSQANALGIVDKFLSVNDVELNPEVCPRKTVEGTSHPVSRGSGTQSLAKGASFRNPVRQTEIFDWVDSHEDEGGGDFFRKRQETFFGSRVRGRRSLKKPQKRRNLHVSKGMSIVDKLKEKEEGLKLFQKVRGLTCPDSRSILHNSKENNNILQISEMKTKKKILEELDEQPNADSPEQQLEATAISVDLPEMYDVGFDTQMAAEAMEALACATDFCQVRQNVTDCSPSGTDKKEVRSEQVSIQKRLPSSDSGSIARQSKRTKTLDAKLNNETTISTCKPFKNLRVESGQVSEVKTAAKMGTLNAEEHSHNGNGVHGKENLGRRSSESTEHRTVGAEDYRTFTPIACRTRKSKAVNSLKGLKSSNGSRGETNNLMDISIRGDKRKGCSLGVDGTNTFSVKGKSSHQIGEVRKNTPNKQEHSRLGEPHEDIPTTSNDKNNALRYPRGRRTRWNMSDHLNKVMDIDELSTLTNGNGQYIPRRKRSKVNVRGLVRAKSSVHSCTNDVEHNMIEVLPEDKVKPPGTTCVTLINRTTPINVASPICMGNSRKKGLCKKSLSRSSLMREIIRLDATEAAIPARKDLRKRRDMANIRVLFSHHLDEDIIKQQKKISARLGVSIASSSSEATHFVTDKFVRTRNMLEAIALGKPVVTHLWLESCGQANCLIDEKNYILRDPKKEKEIGFSMPVSLAHASQSPLLQGRKIFITPKVKPSKELISSLVKAAHGQVVERIGRSAMKDDKIPDNLLILSCEEDYAICRPLLEKGAVVYSSELLLNGIIIQKLENERHHLFTDRLKKYSLHNTVEKRWH